MWDHTNRNNTNRKTPTLIEKLPEQHRAYMCIHKILTVFPLLLQELRMWTVILCEQYLSDKTPCSRRLAGGRVGHLGFLPKRDPELASSYRGPVTRTRNCQNQEKAPGCPWCGCLHCSRQEQKGRSQEFRALQAPRDPWEFPVISCSANGGLTGGQSLDAKPGRRMFISSSPRRAGAQRGAAETSAVQK